VREGSIPPIAAPPRRCIDSAEEKAESDALARLLREKPVDPLHQLICRMTMKGEGGGPLPGPTDNLSAFDAASPFDARYYFSDQDFFRELHPFVSEGAQIRYLARVEAALVATLCEMGVCSAEVSAEIARACEEITPEEVYEEEGRIQHNVRALVNCIRRKIRPASRPYVHLFATSADITDTARALCLKETTAKVILPASVILLRKLIDLARRNADVKQMGRTHGRHAVPLTFGFAIALYVSRLGQRLEAIERAASNLRGKFSGAVGAYNALALHNQDDPAAYESLLMKRLKLEPPEISSQITQPEYVADYVYSLVSCWGILANLADDFRHLLRNEIHEIGDRIESDPQTEVVGSSTMPHKINPKDFENVKSLWKAYMPRITTVLMDQISEHQRDLTNSASGRFVTELVAAFAYAVRRLTLALDSVKPDPQRMAEILESGKDPVVAEPLYVLLSLAGHPDAHEQARVLARQSRVERKPLTEVIREDRSLAEYLRKVPPQRKAVLQDPAQYVGAASQRTLAICDNWESRLDALQHSRLFSQEHPG
jgi:adenylosuccinate lyase